MGGPARGPVCCKTDTKPDRTSALSVVLRNVLDNRTHRNSGRGER